MGCDIHLHFEKKNKDGIWEKIEIDERLLPDDRYYHLFGFLAGVRDYDTEAQFSDRGVPNDSSLDQHFYDCVDHNHTHAYLDEILNAPWELNGLEGCYFYVFCSEILPRLTCFCRVLNDLEKRNIRVIMGFDN